MSLKSPNRLFIIVEKFLKKTEIRFLGYNKL